MSSGPSSRRVALLVDTATSWGRDIVAGVQAYCREGAGWRIHLEARGPDDLSLPADWQGDGVIARVATASTARALRRSRLPVVNVSAIQLPGPGFPRVATDVEAVGRLAASYFLERGFRHFGYYGHPGRDYVRRQREAFAAAVRSAGGGFSEGPVSRRQPGQLAAWLRALPRPAAILLWSEGREVAEACRRLGLAVPEEIAILSGSEDSLLCEVCDPPISAVQQPAERVGREAAALLDRLMQGQPPPRQPRWIPPLSVATRRSTHTLAVNDPRLASALSFIWEHASEPLSVDAVAAATGLSRRVLERRFAAHLRSSPADYIRRAHLEKAKELLARTDLSVPQVAAASGFGSPEYLVHVMRRGTGLSPLRYRRDARGR